MKQKLIIGNWKLNPLTLKGAQEIAQLIDREPRQEAVLCPPTAFLAAIDYPRLAAQDSFWQLKGPYTGQVSPAQLHSLGVRYCLVGHSEKRTLGETDTEINRKAASLRLGGVTPVICVGYGTTIDEDELQVIDVLTGQLTQGLADLDPAKVVVAYEPVWAIGSGQPASPDHAEKIALFIKTKYNVARVLYGGSTNGVNAESFLRQPNIDGLLVGGASLLPDDFNKMINLEI